jgi:mono/diheme cytochrome c family protein
MRHVYVHRAAIVLAVLLVVAAALFAWWRSQDLALVVFVDAGLLAAADEEAEAERDEDAEADRGEDAADPDAWAWQVPGSALYAGACRGCHVRLTHVPELFAADGGRTYLIDLLLFGFEGEAEIEGRRERFDHPPFAERSDEEIAAVLNHLLVSWGNEDDLPDDVADYRPEEVAEARDRELTPAEVAERRPEP